MAFPPYAARTTNFLRDANNGLESPTPLGVDSELNGVMNVVNQLVLKQRSFTNADGTLKTFATATAQALAGSQNFVATAAQTTFTTTIAWSAAFTTLNVWAFTGAFSRIAVVSVANSGGFLQVVLAAQSVSTAVQIAAFESGAGLLSRLQTISVSDGASLVAINDAGFYFTAVTVEAALQEEALARVTLATAVGTTADLIRRTGTVAFTANQSMGGFRLTNVGDGVGAQDAVTMAQFAAYTAVWNALDSYFLRLDGTTPMGANLAMGANRITGLAAGSAATDAVNKTQLDAKLSLAGGAMTGPIAMGTQLITGLAPGVSGTDAINLTQAQSLVASFATLTAYQSAGTNSFAVPAGITKIKVEVFGGGGGGGSGASGGGGGAFALATLAVTPGESLIIVTGIGGTGGAVPLAGGFSSVARGATTLVSAGGGAAGSAAAGSAGGDPTFDAAVTGFGISGGRGQAYSFNNASTDSYGDGSGGDCPRGGQGGIGLIVQTNAGTYYSTSGIAPGGGGGGVSAGSSGAAGAVLVWY